VSKPPTILTSDNLHEYLDPLKVVDTLPFEERLAEITQHELNTIKREESSSSKRAAAKASSSKGLPVTSSSVPRPSSARSTSSIRSRKISPSSTSSSSKRSIERELRSTKQPNRTDDIHTSKSAIHLKQTSSSKGLFVTSSSVPRPSSARSNSSIRSRNVSPPSTSSSSKLPATKQANETDDIHASKPAVDLKQTVKQCSHSVGKLPPTQETTVTQGTGGSEKASIPVASSCARSLSDGEDSKPDELNTTSDLGLSIDSLHSSGEESESAANSKEQSSHKPPVCFEISPPRKNKKHRTKRYKH